MPDFEKEFEEVWVNWVPYAHAIDWKKEFPDKLGDHPTKATKVKIVDHLPR